MRSVREKIWGKDLFAKKWFIRGCLHQTNLKKKIEKIVNINEKNFAGDPQISSEMTLAKKIVTK